MTVNKCKHCEAILTPGKEIMMALDNKLGTFSENSVPDDRVHSWHTLCLGCARKAEKLHKQRDTDASNK